MRRKNNNIRVRMCMCAVCALCQCISEMVVAIDAVVAIHVTHSPVRFTSTQSLVHFL